MAETESTPRHRDTRAKKFAIAVAGAAMPAAAVGAVMYFDKRQLTDGLIGFGGTFVWFLLPLLVAAAWFRVDLRHRYQGLCWVSYVLFVAAVMLLAALEPHTGASAGTAVGLVLMAALMVCLPVAVVVWLISWIVSKLAKVLDA